MTFKPDSNYQKISLNNSEDKAKLKSKEKWWAAVWSGLPVEPTAKHYRAMRNAVWLYLYLLIYANRSTGSLYRHNSTIAGDTGLNPRTVSRWMNALKRGGYIEVRRTGRSLAISITKWKPIKKNNYGSITTKTAKTN